MKTKEENTENMTVLREKIQRDIERIKTLDIEILEGKSLYKEALKYSACSYGCFLLSFLFLFVVPLILHGHASHATIYTSSFFLFAFIMLFLHAITFSSITNYIVLKRTVFPKLETGKFLNDKILSYRNIIVIFMLSLLSLYFLFFLVYGGDVSPNERVEPIKFFGAYVIFLFIPTIFFANILIRVELGRLGLSAFFSLVRSIVDKRSPNGSGSSSSTSGYNPNQDDPMSFTDPRHLNPADPMNFNNSSNPSSYDYQKQHNMDYLDDYHRRERNF